MKCNKIAVIVEGNDYEKRIVNNIKPSIESIC